MLQRNKDTAIKAFQQDGMEAEYEAGRAALPPILLAETRSAGEPDLMQLWALGRGGLVSTSRVKHLFNPGVAQSPEYF